MNFSKILINKIHNYQFEGIILIIIAFLFIPLSAYAEIQIEFFDYYVSPRYDCNGHERHYSWIAKNVAPDFRGNWESGTEKHGIIGLEEAGNSKSLAGKWRTCGALGSLVEIYSQPYGTGHLDKERVSFHKVNLPFLYYPVENIHHVKLIDGKYFPPSLTMAVGDKIILEMDSNDYFFEWENQAANHFFNKDARLTHEHLRWWVGEHRLQEIFGEAEDFVLTINVPQQSQQQELKSELLSEVSKPIPNWIKEVFVFWTNGEISDDELKSVLKFLVENGIIEIKKN